MNIGATSILGAATKATETRATRCTGQAEHGVQREAGRARGWPRAAAPPTGDLRSLLPANCCSDLPVQLGRHPTRLEIDSARRSRWATGRGTKTERDAGWFRLLKLAPRVERILGIELVPEFQFFGLS